MEIERIELDADTPGQNFALRVLRFHGSGNGPQTYLQAGLHANEIPGVVALDRLVPKLAEAEREGRLTSDITLVPQANPIGLAQALFGQTLGRFDFYGRLNFNRSFPTKSTEMLAGGPSPDRLKALLMSLATEAEVVLDLHCDDEGPVYLYVALKQLDEGRRLARALGAEVILTDAGPDAISFDMSVAARWAAEKRPDDTRFAATVEFRGLLDVSAELAEQDASGLYRYLVDIGSVSDELPVISAKDPVIGDMDDAELIVTPVPGAILYNVSVGDWVSEGQCLAVILTDAGKTPHKILAPHEGLVMTRRDRRFARRGDDVIKVLRHLRPGM